MKATFFLMLYLTLTTICLQASAQEKKPNVVLMLIDNQSYFELSYTGNPILQTPNIDKFAEEGVFFSDFNATPFCSPSRAELLTGRYALRAGIYNTVGGVSILNKNEKTLATYMKDAGYRTAIFGKWHLGSTYPYAPQYRGFDEVFVHGGGGVSQLGDYYGNTHMNATFKHNGYYVKSRGFSTDVLFDQGIDFVKRNRETPFFCYIATPAVHFPVMSQPENRKRLEARGVHDTLNLPIYSMIENVDDNVGRMMDYLKKSGLDKNTLVILASDQGVNDRGANMQRSGSWKNRGVEYDEKHQVYCIVQYPKLTDKDPGVRDNLAGIVDIMPTILDICGINIPSNLDGQSLKPLLADTPGWNNDRILIAQCPRKRERIKWDNTSVKYQKWRLVDGKELYNTATDRGETKNIYDEHPDLVKKLKTVYDKFWNSLPGYDELIAPQILGAPQAPSVRLESMDWYVGDAPWTQQGLKNKSAQGKWRVEIARDGRYKMELRRYPREEPRPIEATKTTVIIGNQKSDVPLKITDTHVVVEMNLKKGDYDMETIFTPPKDSVGQKEWGANYVYVDFVHK